MTVTKILPVCARTNCWFILREALAELQVTENRSGTLPGLCCDRFRRMPSPKEKRTSAKRAGPPSQDAEKQLASFLAKFNPEIEAIAKAARLRLQARLPGAIELVYDNYNALAIGFGPSERASEAIFSIALFPRWVSLFFLQAKGLRDSSGLLQGSGKVARHIVLQRAADVDTPAIEELIAQALERAKVPLDPRVPRRLVIKSVSAKQRPRRPAK